MKRCSLWADRLAAALGKPGPAVYAEVNNPQGRIRLRGDIPTPTAVRVVLSAEADPQLVAHIELATPDDASRPAWSLPQLESELAGKLFWLGLGGLLSDLKFTLASSCVAGAHVVPPSRCAASYLALTSRSLLLWMKGWLPPRRSASPSWFRRRRRHPLPIRRDGGLRMPGWRALDIAVAAVCVRGASQNSAYDMRR